VVTCGYLLLVPGPSSIASSCAVPPCWHISSSRSPFVSSLLFSHFTAPFPTVSALSTGHPVTLSGSNRPQEERCFLMGLCNRRLVGDSRPPVLSYSLRRGLGNGIFLTGIPHRLGVSGARVCGDGGRRLRRPVLASMSSVAAARRGASAKAVVPANAISSPGMPGRQFIPSYCSPIRPPLSPCGARFSCDAASARPMGSVFAFAALMCRCLPRPRSSAAAWAAALPATHQPPRGTNPADTPTLAATSSTAVNHAPGARSQPTGIADGRRIPRCCRWGNDWSWGRHAYGGCWWGVYAWGGSGGGGNGWMVGRGSMLMITIGWR